MSLKRVLLLVAGLALIGIAIGIALWNKPHENMQQSKASAVLDAAALFQAFNTNEQEANVKYLGKTIVVTGKVKESSAGEGVPAKVSLETGDAFLVVCELDALSQHPRTSFNVGETLKLKGKCDGINLDVQLSRCIEVK